MMVRAADPIELDQLARIWFDGWRDGHAGLLPDELARTRTFESFRARMQDALPCVRVCGPPGAPLGFHLVKADELNQLFVAAHARGTGVAAALIADAEAQFAARGVETAWLACAIGNHRAARFYEKSGWRRTGTFVYQAPMANGTFPVETWRYEKPLRGAADARPVAADARGD